MVTKAYLDTCIISGMAKQDIAAAEQTALLTILQRQKSGEVALVTSDMARREIDAIPEQHRLKHQFIYNLIVEVPIAKAFRIDTGLMLMGVGGGRRLVKEMAQLTTLLKDEADASHIYQAFKNEVSIFLTVDERTVLSKAREIEGICGVKAMMPSGFVNEFLHD
jgi:hypothetical protein